MDGDGVRLDALTFGVVDPAAMARFWGAALRWDVAAGSGRSIDLVPTDGTAFTLRFELDPIDKQGPNRQHLDLTTSSVAEQAASVEELLAVGGRHHDVGQLPEERHVVLADPEGNELCLVEHDNGFLADCDRLGAISCDGTREVGVFWSEALGWPLIWDLENVSRIPDHLPTNAVTATGLGSCYVTTKYLLIHCKDDLNGYRPVRDSNGYMQYDYDAQGNPTPRRIPLNGGLSALGGTMYGSVFMENEGAGGWDMKNYVNPWAGNDLFSPPEQVEHHEQVHAQQWAKQGWNFATAYLSAGAQAAGEASWFNYWNPWSKRVDGCFNVYERDAHWRYGGYGRNPAPGYTNCPSQASVPHKTS